jgi:tetratricopeptide (TPR) repeat protein
LSPLAGEPYLRLGELCFLEGRGFAEADAYLQQATMVRPFDGNLLFEVGRQWGARGLEEWGAACWSRAMHIRGSHRVHIAQSLAGRLPVAETVALFAPQWDTLPEFWRTYQSASPDEAAALVDYARQQAERESAAARAEKAVFIWRSLAQMEREAGQADAALASLQRACSVAPEDFASRKLLGLELCAQNRPDEAESHLRWCRDRRPDDPAVDAALMHIGRERYAASQDTTIR